MAGHNHNQRAATVTKKCLWCVDFDCGHCIDKERAKVNFTQRLCSCNHSDGVT